MNDKFDTITFKTIGIYGVGLLGGSLGLAIKKVLPGVTIIGIGRNESRLKQAKDCGAIDEWTTESSISPKPLDLLVLCTPVRILADNLKDSLPSLSDDALITDVGSTKAKVVTDCEKLVVKNQVFIGSHPMAGSHKSGITAADETLFEDRTCVITPSETSPQDAVQKIADFWQLIGMKIVYLSPEEHDALTAISSHLPHLTASALCQVARNTSPKVKEVIGTGFCDTTRIASGDANIWVDICLENAQEIDLSITELINYLKELQSYIKHRQDDKIALYLEKAKDFRDQF